jgi:hypothetical protein
VTDHHLAGHLPSCEHDVPLRDVCDACSAETAGDALRATRHALALIAERSSDRWAAATARRALAGDPDPDAG